MAWLVLSYSLSIFYILYSSFIIKLLTVDNNFGIFSYLRMDALVALAQLCAVVTLAESPVHALDIRPGQLPPEVGDELGDHEAEDDQIVALAVLVGNANLGLLIEFLLPMIHISCQLQ